MPRCRNKSCKQKLPKGAKPPLVCSAACRDAAIADALAKKRAADARAAARARNVAEREAKEQRRQLRAKKLAFRANDLPHQIELTQKVFNTMIRLLDRGKRCPTCDEPLVDGEYDAGHVRTVASCPQLRFHAAACFGQCRRCNGSGTIRRRVKKTQEVVSELFKAWVLRELGQAHYDWLYGPHPSVKWICAELAAMRAVFATEVARLKKGLPPSRDWRALPIQEERLSGKVKQEIAA